MHRRAQGKVALLVFLGSARGERRTMSGTVSFTRHGAIAVASIENPPVNALSHGVRVGLMAALERTAQDAGVAALIICGSGRNFPAGADVREFGRPFEPPELNAVIERTERCRKPVIAALHGNALGGGLELALACHFRVALAGTRLGLPEVKLGIIPGGGGTQRLPRLIGARAALTVIAEGKDLVATEAQRLGLLDECVTGELQAAALVFAQGIVREGRPLRRTGELTARLDEPEVFEEFTRRLAKKQRGFTAPLEAVKAVRLAYELPFTQGLRQELELCMALLEGEQSRAQRHAFAAEREIARIPGIAADTAVREIATAAVVGSGVMEPRDRRHVPGQRPGSRCSCSGRSADALAAAPQGPSGRPTRRAQSPAAALGQAEAERRLRAHHGDPRERRSSRGGSHRRGDVAEELDREGRTLRGDSGVLAKPGAILASNTSFLDLNTLAQASRRPQEVAGLHFFEPRPDPRDAPARDRTLARDRPRR